MFNMSFINKVWGGGGWGGGGVNNWEGLVI